MNSEPKKAQASERCRYRWGELSLGSVTVLTYMHCRRGTWHPSGYCWQHRPTCEQATARIKANREARP